MDEEEIRLAVKRGIHWLDEEHPSWAQKINLKRLKMDNCYQCIIGQAVGNFSGVTHAASASGPSQWAIEHGFQAPYCYYRDGLSLYEYYERLEALWTGEVQRRLG